MRLEEQDPLFRLLGRQSTPDLLRAKEMSANAVVTNRQRVKPTNLESSGGKWLTSCSVFTTWDEPVRLEDGLLMPPVRLTKQPSQSVTPAW
jgi:hypothetical protein